jgi:hypothetical protein
MGMPHRGGRISETQRLWIYTQMTPKFRVGARREIRDGLVNCSRRINVSDGVCWAASDIHADPWVEFMRTRGGRDDSDRWAPRSSGRTSARKWSQAVEAKEASGCGFERAGPSRVLVFFFSFSFSI